MSSYKIINGKKYRFEEVMDLVEKEFWKELLGKCTERIIFLTDKIREIEENHPIERFRTSSIRRGLITLKETKETNAYMALLAGNKLGEEEIIQ